MYTRKVLKEGAFDTPRQKKPRVEISTVLIPFGTRAPDILCDATVTTWYPHTVNKRVVCSRDRPGHTSPLRALIVYHLPKSSGTNVCDMYPSSFDKLLLQHGTYFRTDLAFVRKLQALTREGGREGGYEYGAVLRTTNTQRIDSATEASFVYGNPAKPSRTKSGTPTTLFSE